MRHPRPRFEVGLETNAFLLSSADHSAVSLAKMLHLVSAIVSQLADSHVASLSDSHLISICYQPTVWTNKQLLLQVSLYPL